MNIGPAVIALSLFGCTMETVPDDLEDPGQVPSVDVGDSFDMQGSEDATDGVPADPVPLVADMCDEAPYTGATWQTLSTTHFTLSYLPGTVADEQKLEIGARLEDAYATIRAGLGVTAEPHIAVTLSPSRTAAAAHGKAFGRAWPNLARYEVIYTGAADSYESTRYGQLLTLVLDFQIDSMNRYRAPVLATGVAEYLDHSGRNMHDAYAQQLLAGIESRVRVAEMDTKDVNGRNPGRSGSLVQFLVDHYGLETFHDIYRATAVTWNGSCNVHGTYGCLGTPAQLTAMLDGVLTGLTGDSWADVQAMWLAEVDAALERAPVGMDAASTAEIENLVATMDRAISADDAAQYRTTLEGFYCEWGGDAGRDEIAARAVNAYGTMSSQILGLYATGTKNFSTAQAFVMRTDEHGVPTFATLQFEHLPVGWRVTYSPDWY